MSEEMVIREALYAVGAIIFWIIFYTKLNFLKTKGTFLHVAATVGLAIMWFPMIFIIGAYLMLKHSFECEEPKLKEQETF